MQNIIIPKKGDQILISLINKAEVLGSVEFLSDDFIVVKPNSKNCLCVINLNNICCYYLSNNEIFNYINGKKEIKNEKDTIYHDINLNVGDVEDKFETLKKLREKQRKIELENMRAKMTSFEPSFTQGNYGTITKV